MKTILLPLGALLIFSTSGEDVGVRYEPDTTLRVATKATSTTRLVSSSVTFDGEDMGAEEPEGEQVTVRSMEYVDRILTAENGRRTALERWFESIGKVETEEGEETSDTGVLEGRTIRIEMTEDGETSAEIADDDSDVDAVYLEGFDLRYNEELLLPEDEVEPGDSWSVGGDAARRYFGLVDGVTWFEEKDDEEGDGPDFEELFADELGGEVEVTFVGPEERDGREVWSFTYELEMSGSLDDLQASELGLFGEGEGMFDNGEVMLEAAVDGRGHFWIDRETHLIVASDGEGEVAIQLEVSVDMAAHELLMSLEIGVDLEGWTTYETE